MPGHEHDVNAKNVSHIHSAKKKHQIELDLNAKANTNSMPSAFRPTQVTKTKDKNLPHQKALDVVDFSSSPAPGQGPPGAGGSGPKNSTSAGILELKNSKRDYKGPIPQC